MWLKSRIREWGGEVRERGEGEQTDGIVGRRSAGASGPKRVRSRRKQKWKKEGGSEMKEDEQLVTLSVSFTVSRVLLLDSFLVIPLLVYSALPAVFFPNHPFSLKTPCSPSCCVFPARHFHSPEIQLNILWAPSDKHRKAGPLSSNFKNMS